VTVLATHSGEPVLAREGSVLVSTFHPELTDDPAVHRYFLGLRT
jgi:5'-phosphate synthase pdxT subunit